MSAEDRNFVVLFDYHRKAMFDGKLWIWPRRGIKEASLNAQQGQSS
ncbi:hypothetical protein F444_20592 [Phytophthora nicotianae P1976]|uniref:Uncharacterized protein n=1 Tax=Phytophthora nicotianae P1976 TaxID=1317066 RepID=A0A080Z434_PHYNI|nr:hypothetical protein F444_20592 [Phytophthora nicotianae P1976]